VREARRSAMRTSPRSATTARVIHVCGIDLVRARHRRREPDRAPARSARRAGL